MSRYALSRLMLALILCSIALSGSTWAGEVYRWKDAQGVTHYGDRKPEDANAERLDVHVPPPAAPVEAHATSSEQVPTDPAAAAEKRKQDRAMWCERAKRNLEVLTQAENVSIRSEGSTEAMTAERRQLEIEANQRAVAQYCEAASD